MITKYTLLLFFSIIIFTSLTSVNIAGDNEDLENLTSWMTGSFSSQEQSEADTNYYDIRLEMVQIWKERTDAIWLYIEQAASWALEKPYRQRVYRVVKNADGTLESGVYTFDDPLRFAGAWKEEIPLAGLSPDSLSERSGCAIILDFKDAMFVGSTDEKNCSSVLRGASYATSEVEIEENVLKSWDRGFNENDEQVWGARFGPYIFKKIKNYD